jgi:hypothetical protein
MAPVDMSWTFKEQTAHRRAAEDTENTCSADILSTSVFLINDIKNGLLKQVLKVTEKICNFAAFRGTDVPLAKRVEDVRATKDSETSQKDTNPLHLSVSVQRLISRLPPQNP